MKQSCHDIDIIWVNLREVQFDWAVLSSEEQQRYESIICPDNASQFAKSRGILRQILANYLKLEPIEIRFCYNTFGKPSIISEQNLQQLNFNISHSGYWFVCAVAQNQAVGIDIEVMRPLIGFESLAESRLSAAQWRQFRHSNYQEQQQLFFSEWTRQEAIFKVIGEPHQRDDIHVKSLECPPNVIGHIANHRFKIS